MGKKRYMVRATGYGCVLTLADGYSPTLDGGHASYEFWCPGDGGYVYETTHSPGTSGRQVGETLFGGGLTLRAYRGNLTALIRGLAKRHCDAIDRG